MKKFDKRMSIQYIIVLLFLFIIPMYTVLLSYDTIKNGKEYKFKVEAFDPYDMFRGNYINLNFKEDSIKNYNNIDILTSNGIEKDYYVLIQEASDGFAYFSDISKVKPKNSNYYTTSVNCYIDESYVKTPDKYYMNEKKSMQAELAYNKNVNNTYVKVKVKDGNMVIVGVYINDILVDSLVEK